MQSTLLTNNTPKQQHKHTNQPTHLHQIKQHPTTQSNQLTKQNPQPKIKTQTLSTIPTQNPNRINRINIQPPNKTNQVNQNNKQASIKNNY